MVLGGAQYLDQNKEYVDELNVFPVPDGDTGTNMSLTVLSAAKEVQKIESPTIGTIAKALSTGSLRGARGNSGVILSQLFRGFSNEIGEHEFIDTTVLSNALQKGVETAYKAVMKPREGTILTVAREGAERSLQLAEESNDLLTLIEETISYAQEVLNRTPDMLPVLKQAGVVDAGGQGLLFILRGAYAVLTGQSDFELTDQPNDSVQIRDTRQIDTDNIQFRYCTEFIIQHENIPNQKIMGYKDFLESMGDSLVTVNDGEIMKVHVHTNEPGKVITEALKMGSLINIKIDNMKEQHSHRLSIQEQKEVEFKEHKEFGFITVSIGEGLNHIFYDLGVDYILEGGQTMNPSTEDMLKAIEAVQAETVIILPNNKNIILAAEQAKELTKEKKIIVIPSKTIPQGITAILNFDQSLEIEQNLKNIEDSLQWVKTGQVTYAVRDTQVDDQVIHKDDILGIADGHILHVGKDIEQTVKNLMGKMVDADSEIISLYYGSDIEAEQAQELADYLEEEYEECEIEVHSGGQPIYYYIFSVE